MNVKFSDRTFGFATILKLKIYRQIAIAIIMFRQIRIITIPSQLNMLYILHIITNVD